MKKHLKIGSGSTHASGEFRSCAPVPQPTLWSELGAVQGKAQPLLERFPLPGKPLSLIL